MTQPIDSGIPSQLDLLEQRVAEECKRRESVDQTHRERLDRLDEGQRSIQSDVTAIKARVSGINGWAVLFVVAVLSALANHAPAMVAAISSALIDGLASAKAAPAAPNPVPSQGRP